MNSNLTWELDDSLVVGRMPKNKMYELLRELGESDVPDPTEDGEPQPMGFFDTPRPYEYTSHAFGFIPAQSTSAVNPIAIIPAGALKADASLKGSRVRVTLDRLRVFKYPGAGLHQVLVTFASQHHVQGSSEIVNFSQIYCVQDGQNAGIAGNKVFEGLSVGDDGLAFKCMTVNVKNRDDERALGFLDSSEFKSGMKLLNTANPIIPIVSGLAVGITQMVLKRNRNICVQEVIMGLDFSAIPTRARLAEGAYIAVQVPDAAAWAWTDWVFNPQSGQIVPKLNPVHEVRFNYFVFSISRI
jgi:hypothetical protein